MGVLCHNTWVGQERRSAVRNLGVLADRFDFDVAFLQEAKRLDGNLLPGYKNSAAPASMGADHDNCRLLIRERGTRFIDHGAVKVPGPGWAYNDKPKPTRVYPWEAFERHGQVYVAVCVHRIPMGPHPPKAVNRAAWNAEHKALVALVRALLARFPGAVIILGGDWNAEWSERPDYKFSLQGLARDLGGNVNAVVLHIDGLIVVNGRPRSVTKLDQLHGSDKHRPVVGKVVPG